MESSHGASFQMILILNLKSHLKIGDEIEVFIIRVNDGEGTCSAF